MRVELGPIVGAVSHDEARIWFLAEYPADVRVHVFRDPGFEIPGSPFRPDALDSLAGTATTRIPLPEPGARYRYDLCDADGRGLLPAGFGSPGFRSASPPGVEAAFRFALASCNDLRSAVRGPGFGPDEAPWRALQRAIADEGIAFLICAGDQVYMDHVWRQHVTNGTAFPPTTRRAYQAAYEAQWSWPDLRRALANVPTYMVWDDHDIRNGWGSEARDATSAKRRAGFEVAREVYWRFQHEHNPPSFCCPDDDLFYAFRYGEVGFLVLDLRGARDATKRRDALLGAHQWAAVTRWLDAELPRLRALFVVASVPPVHLRSLATIPGGWASSDLADQWTSRPNRAELRRMVEELFGRSNALDLPVALLGGDAHVGTTAVIRSRRPEHARRPAMLQLTSSPLTSAPFAPLVRNPPSWFRRVPIAPGIEGEILDWLPERNFGVVEVAPAADGYEIVLRLVDEHGVTRVRRG